MTPELIQQLGDDLFAALRERRTLVPFTNRFADITVEDAYGISLQFLNRRVASGERVIGNRMFAGASGGIADEQAATDHGGTKQKTTSIDFHVCSPWTYAVVVSERMALRTRG